MMDQQGLSNFGSDQKVEHFTAGAGGLQTKKPAHLRIADTFKNMVEQLEPAMREYANAATAVHGVPPMELHQQKLRDRNR